MNIKELKIRWARSYIEPSLFYLPVKGGKLVNVTIKPLTHIKDYYFQIYPYSESQIQYYVPMYNDPAVTGNIPRYNVDNQLGYYKGCKYRIYKKVEKDGETKYISITPDGIMDEEEKMPLSENEQTFTLSKGEYYYKEYVSAPGDILHFKCDRFVIDEDSEDFTLEIDHKPRIIRVYPKYVKGREGFAVEFKTKNYHTFDQTWGAYWRETEFDRHDSITENPYFKIYPTVKNIDYMGRDFTEHINYKFVENTVGSVFLGINLYKRDVGGGSAGVELSDYYEQYSVTPSEEKVNKDIFYDNVLIHSGYEMIYTPFTNKWLHALYDDESYGNGGSTIDSSGMYAKGYTMGFVCYPGFALSLSGSSNGFWYHPRSEETAAWQENMTNTYDYVSKPITSDEKKYFDDALYTISAEIQANKGKRTTVYDVSDTEVSESIIVKQTTASYASPEDVAGMPMWLCNALTSGDPEIPGGYTPPAAGEGVPLRYSITLFEKEIITPEGENDTVYKTIINGYSQDDPLIPYESPNKRKAKDAIAGTGLTYDNLDELLQEEYTTACNAAVVFERQSRRGYKQWFTNETELFESNDDYSKDT